MPSLLMPEVVFYTEVHLAVCDQTAFCNGFQAPTCLRTREAVNPMKLWVWPLCHQEGVWSGR